MKYLAKYFTSLVNGAYKGHKVVQIRLPYLNTAQSLTQHISRDYLKGLLGCAAENEKKL